MNDDRPHPAYGAATMHELLSCPFCGTQPTLIPSTDSRNVWVVRCGSCGVQVQIISRDGAHRVWNRRPANAAVALLEVEALLEAIVSARTLTARPQDVLQEVKITARDALAALRRAPAYTSTGQRDDVMRWSGRGPDPRLDELLDDLEKAAEYRATMVGENAEGDHVFESGVMIVDARNAIYEYLRSHPADNAAGGQYEAWTAYINSPDHGSSRRDAFLAGWQSARHQPVESGQQNQQGDEREIVARWLWEHDDEISDGSMQDASWDAATDMRAGYYAAADDLLARLSGGQQSVSLEQVERLSRALTEIERAMYRSDLHAGQRCREVEMVLAQLKVEGYYGPGSDRRAGRRGRTNRGDAVL